ncbi:ABC transporter ATP-binding protein [Alkalibacterium iburiense]|uniref:ABC transporter ATP-binding protein n=1 Tax=Alkalibacterium iburiense TaxID=290589 RepID=A0ABP3HBF6_9LACT
MEPKVEFKNVSLKENDFQILNTIQLSLMSNKTIGLIGRNGAGKTSLLSLLASYRLPTNGQVLIDGEEAFENDDKMEQVVFIYPEDYTEESDTVKDTLTFMSRYLPNYDSDYAAYLIERFKLPLDKKVNELSKGMQSALNVTSGLASRAPITIFDEAYLSMDAPSRDIFYEELQEDQIKHPRLIIMSTHLVSEAEYLFDEVAILHKGQLLYHEEYESLVSKGITITGDKAEVDALVASYEQINEKHLGNVKSVTVFGEKLEQLVDKAESYDVEISPVSLQQLFNHLTEERQSHE